MNFFSQCLSFAMSIVSRGIIGKKAEPPVKQLRVLSCFGNNEIPPCSNLVKSKKHEGHFCSACGCGDMPHTQLLINGKTYSKLDYPYLSCPLKMPGFSNYDPASPREVSEKNRKSLIEVYDTLRLSEIDVSSPDPTDDEYLLFKKLSKITTNTIPK